jgi:hypothetical protein
VNGIAEFQLKMSVAGTYKFTVKELNPPTGLTPLRRTFEIDAGSSRRRS